MQRKNKLRIAKGIGAISLAYAIGFLASLPLGVSVFPKQDYFPEAAKTADDIQARNSNRNNVPPNQLAGYDRLTRALVAYERETKKRGNERNRMITEYLDKSWFFGVGLIRHKEI